MTLYGEHDVPGRLFTVEGIDGSGKSTQLTLLAQWLRKSGYPVVFSEWNSSPIVRETTSRGKRRKLLTPLTFSLIHATDFTERVDRELLPALKAGAIVLADRYVYTAFARDVARGVNSCWLRNLYRFAVRPTIAFYFRISVDDALKRIVGGRDAISYYEAGMDQNLSGDVEESFRLFQGKVIAEYDRMVDEFGLVVIDASGSIEEQQVQMRQIVTTALTGVRKTRIRRWVDLNATD